MSAVLSGPMFEPAEGNFFRSLFSKTGAHYNIYSAGREAADGMAAIRQIFPDGEADELNFCLFSTSGVHGSYQTIEEAEEHLNKPSEETHGDVTFLIVHPRIVCLRYGNCQPQNADDISFLKKLRASSWRAVKKIGESDAASSSQREDK